MGRAARIDVDYFPHPVKHGKKMFFLEQKYKNDGYAVWFKLLEELGKSDRHYIDLSDELTIVYLSSNFNVTEQLLNEIINDLLRLGEFDKYLFSNQILYNEKFVISVEDAYKKRTSDTPFRQNLINYLFSIKRIKSNHTTDIPEVSAPDIIITAPEMPISVGIYPQRERERERESKGKEKDYFVVEKKEMEIILPKPDFANNYSSMDDVKLIILQPSNWRDTICMHHSVKPDLFEFWINKFFIHCLTDGKEHKRIDDFKQHFNNWLRKQETDLKNNSDQQHTTEIKKETPTERRNRILAEQQQQQKTT